MKLQCAKYAGACFGVERALKLVERVAQEVDTVYTLGPLIHNPQVVQRLETQGVQCISSISDVTEGCVVIRTHGISPKSIELIDHQNISFLDATCPFVKKVHESAQELENQGYEVFVIGELGHPEVDGILGHMKRGCVLTSKNDIPQDLSSRVGIVVQTTQSIDLVEEIVSEILPKVKDLRFINTICKATKERQTETEALAQTSDIMLIVGGKNSANTTRLFEIAQKHCVNTHHIEVVQEIKDEWFEDVYTIGVSAGASTPKYLIQEILDHLTTRFDID